MKNILITGGSGMIGRKLTSYLENNGYKVAWLSRNTRKKKQKTFEWDVENNTLDEKALAWCDGIVHLAGTGVADKRWTDKRKKEILESRIRSTQLLYNKVQKLKKKPNAFISASGVNYYGYDTGLELMDEESSPGEGFLAETVIKWEKVALKFQALGIRTVIIRTGMVLDQKGGALAEILKPPVAAPLGSGKQYVSWIHIKDLVALYSFALAMDISGIYNGVSPHPVINKSLTQMAAKEKGKLYAPIPVPAFILNLILGEMAQMVIGGIRASSKKAESSGFEFKYPFLEDAIKDIFNKRK